MHRLLISSALLLACTPLLAAKPPVSAPLFRSGEVIVKYRHDVDSAPARLLKSAHALTPVTRLGDGRTELLRLPSMVDVSGAMAMLREDSEVEFAQPNYLRRKLAVLPNDALFSQQWGLSNTGQANFFSGGPAGNPGGDMHLTQAWDSAGTGVADRTGDGTVVVAIVDDGFDTAHPDLAANFIAGFDFKGNDSDPSPGSADDAHGTEVAGTIGAVGNNSEGIASPIWDVQLMPLRFDFDTASEVAALEFARTHGAKIVNASFGGPTFDPAELDELRKLESAGILFVASAGNESSNTDFSGAHYPSAYGLSNILAVAATNRQDDIASFSTLGATAVHVAAPGLQIVTTTLDGRYSLNPGVSGTSFSAGYVSGVAALVKNTVPAADALELKSRLIEGADAGVDAANPVNLRVAGGRVNAASSLALAARPSLTIKPVQIASFSTDDTGTMVSVPIMAPVKVLNDTNGNGALDPGDTADLQISLQNLWNAATGVQGQLSASDGVVVNSGSVSYGNIAHLGSANASFNISVPAGLSGHHYLRFALALTDASGYSAVRRFTIELGTLANGLARTQNIGTDLYDHYHSWVFTLNGPLPAGQDTLTFQSTAGNDIDFLVSYAAPVQYAVDLEVNDIPGADTSDTFYYFNVPDAQAGAGPGGNEFVNFRNPAPGTYFVTVINYDKADNAPYTLKAFTNQGGVGGFASSTLAANATRDNSHDDHGGGSVALTTLAMLLGLFLLGQAARGKLRLAPRR